MHKIRESIKPITPSQKDGKLSVDLWSEEEIQMANNPRDARFARESVDLDQPY